MSDPLNICVGSSDPGISGSIAFAFTAYPRTISAEDTPNVAGEIDAANLALRISMMKPDGRGRKMTEQPSDEFNRASRASVREARSWLLRNAIEEHGDLFVSCGVSLREAAYRGQDGAVRIHLSQIRRILVDAVEVLKELEAVRDQLPNDTIGAT